MPGKQKKIDSDQRARQSVCVVAIALVVLLGDPSRRAGRVLADEPSTTLAHSAPEDPTVSATKTTSGVEDSVRPLPALLPLITEEAIVGAVLYPRQFFNSPVVRRLPVEITAADLENRIGIDLRQVEFAIIFLERAHTQPLSAGFIVQFVDSFDWRRIAPSVLRRTVFGKVDGRPYRKGKGPLDLSLLQLDSRTLILAPDQTMRRMLSTREAMPSDESISQQLSQGIGKSLDIHLAINAQSLRPLVALQLDQVGGRTDAWQAFAQMLDEVERFELRARISHQLAVGAIMDTTSDAAATRVQTMVKTWGEAMAARESESDDVSPRPASSPQDDLPRVSQDEQMQDRIQQLLRYGRRSVCQRMASNSVRVAGSRVQWGARGDTAAQMATCAAVTMLVDPAIQSFSPAMSRWQSIDGMQRLSSAMLAHADRYDRFPARASYSDDKRALLSWRVHLLPLLGHEPLYKQFRLDESWDSPHNRKLIRSMPAVYQNPRRPCDYRTTYTVPVGAGTMFEGTAGLPKDDIRDGAGNTLMLVDADEDHAVVWTQPNDLRYDPRDPWCGLGKRDEAGFLGARADGTVRFFFRSLDQLELRAFFSRDGGETQLH